MCVFTLLCGYPEDACDVLSLSPDVDPRIYAFTLRSSTIYIYICKALIEGAIKTFMKNTSRANATQPRVRLESLPRPPTSTMGEHHATSGRAPWRGCPAHPAGAAPRRLRRRCDGALVSKCEVGIWMDEEDVVLEGGLRRRCQCRTTPQYKVRSSPLVL